MTNSSATKKWLLASKAVSLISLLVLSLLSTTFSSGWVAQAAPSFSVQPLQLSATSGPTGTLLTISGKGLQQYGYTSGDLEVTSTTGDPTFPPYLIFGTVSFRSDGTFTWQGPLPQGGIDPNTGQTQNFIMPKGKIRIQLGQFGLNVAGTADFTVTANSSGPLVNNTSYSRANSRMTDRWLRIDSPVRDSVVKRSWTWGPNVAGTVGLMEPYKEAPNGWRWVEYFDKARMEATYPEGDVNTLYYITNGLLVKELITGQLQVGYNSFENRGAAQIPAAGDLGVNSTPTFADYAPVLSRNDNQDGQAIVETLSKGGGTVASDNSLASKYNVTAGHLIKETQHYIASPFWQYLTSSGPIYDIVNGQVGVPISQGPLFYPPFDATGFPITEAYWTKTVVNGQPKDVLVQMFERRSLTYTPANPVGFQVEMGNVGLEYYNWRYGNPS